MSGERKRRGLFLPSAEGVRFAFRGERMKNDGSRSLQDRFRSILRLHGITPDPELIDSLMMAVRHMVEPREGTR